MMNADKIDCFFYNGSIERGNDLAFIDKVSSEKESSFCKVVMTTPGGSPDAAYKMARHLQNTYEKWSVIIPGMCKSAGTLFAIGANELIFLPSGELGPIDIQLQKDDKLKQESGLNINEAMDRLENSASLFFQANVMEIIRRSGGAVTFKTAAEISADIVEGLYGKIFAQIEPEEVGSRVRAMRIGVEYARRLNPGNLKDDALKNLIEGYPSHGFVIDHLESRVLFNHVRGANEEEQKIVDTIEQKHGKDLVRFGYSDLIIEKIDIQKTGDSNEQQTDNRQAKKDIGRDKKNIGREESDIKAVT